MTKRILIIDGKSNLQESFNYLFLDGFEIETVNGGSNGLARMVQFNPSVVILDAALTDMNFLGVLEEIQRAYSQTKTINISSFQDMGATIKAMKLGAYDFVHDDINTEELRKKINKTIRLLALRDQLSRLGVDESITPLGNQIVGKSKAMLEIFKFISTWVYGK